MRWEEGWGRESSSQEEPYEDWLEASLGGPQTEQYEMDIVLEAEETLEVGNVGNNEEDELGENPIR